MTKNSKGAKQRKKPTVGAYVGDSTNSWYFLFKSTESSCIENSSPSENGFKPFC